MRTITSPVAIKPTERHAVYVTTDSGVCFRIGQPTTWLRAIARWQRLVARSWVQGREQFVRHDGRLHRVSPDRSRFEVRAVDTHGRGLGSDRHGLAFPVPFRNLRLAAR